MTKNTHSKAYIMGGGIGGLSAAVYLIQEGGYDPANITLLDFASFLGGCLDGQGNATTGFVARGERMLADPTYPSLWDVLKRVPMPDGKGTLYEDYAAFNKNVHTYNHCRLVDNDQKRIDANQLGMTKADIQAWIDLYNASEESTENQRIQEYFSADFFSSNYWAMWRTFFGLHNWSSLTEFRRYIRMFGDCVPVLNTLSILTRARMIGYYSWVVPMEKYLLDQGVKIQKGVRIVDTDFESREAGVTLTRLIGTGPKGEPLSISLTDDDIAIITIGSLVADSAYGSDSTPAPLITDRRDGSWTLWENMANKFPGNLGNPQKFCGKPLESAWMSFTLTMHSPVFYDYVRQFTNNDPGTGALCTFKDSSWFLSHVVPYQPYFANQPEGVYTSWGYGLLLKSVGDYVKKPLIECNGKEILTELVGHFGANDILDEVLETTTVITSMLPYIVSQFQPRMISDRPRVRPSAANNFAVIGQFVEVEEGCVFTVEYSVRGAMTAVYSLCNIDKPVPGAAKSMQTPEIKKAVISALETGKELQAN